jgi:hypothetical protein
MIITGGDAHAAPGWHSEPTIAAPTPNPIAAARAAVAAVVDVNAEHILKLHRAGVGLGCGQCHKLTPLTSTHLRVQALRSSNIGDRMWGRPGLTVSTSDPQSHETARMRMSLCARWAGDARAVPVNTLLDCMLHAAPSFGTRRCR